MNAEQPEARPGHSTGPKTPEGKARCSLKRRFHSSTNAYRHGLTGRICIRTADEQQAYDRHSQIVLKALKPVGDHELDIAQCIADDRWRLKRARSIEDGVFALAPREQVAGTGSLQVDEALAQTQSWLQEARSLQLLTIYEQRIQRSVDKNKLELKALQAERKELARQAMVEAKKLYELAQAQGKPYQPEAIFVRAPQVEESVFSGAEVAREISREKLKSDAHEYHWRGKLPRNSEPKQPVDAAA